MLSLTYRWGTAVNDPAKEPGGTFNTNALTNFSIRSELTFMENSDRNSACRSGPGPVPGLGWAVRPGERGKYVDNELTRTPKLEGHRVTLKARVYPDQHDRAIQNARRRGFESMSAYIAALVDQDAGLPTKLNPTPQTELPIARSA